MIPQEALVFDFTAAAGRASSPRPRRATARVVLALTVVLAVTAGCTASYPASHQSLEDAVIALPELTLEQQLRDEIARVDAAALQRALDADLPAVAKSANERLEAVGGLWDPWEDIDFAERPELVFEQPMSIQEAPGEEEELANFMLDAAASQMMGVATAPGLSPEERLSLTAVLSGRVVAATVMRKELGLPVAASAYVPADGGWVPSEASAPSPAGGADGAQSAELPTFDQVKESSALNAYDCVAGSLLAASSQGAASVTNARSVALVLEDRVIALRELGAQDIRGPRCLLNSASGEDLVRHLIYTDLGLIASDSVDTRVLGVAYLFEDSVLWASNFPDSADRTSVLVSATTSLETAQSVQSGD